MLTRMISVILAFTALPAMLYAHVQPAWSSFTHVAAYHLPIAPSDYRVTVIADESGGATEVEMISSFSLSWTASVANSMARLVVNPAFLGRKVVRDRFTYLPEAHALRLDDTNAFGCLSCVSNRERGKVFAVVAQGEQPAWVALAAHHGGTEEVLVLAEDGDQAAADAVRTAVQAALATSDLAGTALTWLR